VPYCLSFALAIVPDLLDHLKRLPAQGLSSRTTSRVTGRRTLGQSTRRSKPLSGVRVLVIEDDVDSADALRQLLQVNGADVECACSAQAGRVALARQRPDVLISDLSMPGEDGYAFLASVRAMTRDDGGRVPAMAFSAMPPGIARSRAHDVGYQVFLRKPEDVPLIVPTVLRLLPAGFAA
jgi:CheY-like chemotaxis protein